MVIFVWGKIDTSILKKIHGIK